MNLKTNEQGLLTTGEVAFDFYGTPHTIEVREDYDHHKTPWKYRRAKARAFVWSDSADVSQVVLEDTAKLVGAEHIHSSKGEYPLLDLAWKLNNEMEVALLTAVLQAGFKALGLENEKAKFSRYAGCSCPCSPGFILQSNENVKGYFDIYINKVKVDKEDQTKVK